MIKYNGDLVRAQKLSSSSVSSTRSFDQTHKKSTTLISLLQSSVGRHKLLQLFSIVYPTESWKRVMKAKKKH